MMTALVLLEVDKEGAGLEWWEVQFINHTWMW